MKKIFLLLFMINTCLTVQGNLIEHKIGRDVYNFDQGLKKSEEIPYLEDYFDCEDDNFRYMLTQYCEFEKNTIYDSTNNFLFDGQHVIGITENSKFIRAERIEEDLKLEILDYQNYKFEVIDSFADVDKILVSDSDQLIVKSKSGEVLRLIISNDKFCQEEYKSIGEVEENQSSIVLYSKSEVYEFMNFSTSYSKVLCVDKYYAVIIGAFYYYDEYLLYDDSLGIAYIKPLPSEYCSVLRRHLENHPFIASVSSIYKFNFEKLEFQSIVNLQKYANPYFEAFQVQEYNGKLYISLLDEGLIYDLKTKEFTDRFVYEEPAFSYWVGFRFIRGEVFVACMYISWQELE
ncbi:MAG: hypothetical protein JXR63_00860 [Spirochaetales bacterium]|nr:hypothetical protein [Spirochaetales bacterium]